MTIEYDIRCDGCEAVIDGSHISAAVARRQIRAEGGRVNLHGGKDLCASCVAAGRQPQ